MKIERYSSVSNREHWLEQIGRSGWDAGKLLYEMLRDGKFGEFSGEKAEVLLLTDGDRLVSYCTYAEQDDIRGTELTPWAGFVYTFPEYRGKRCMGKLLEHVYALAKADGFEYVYISTGEVGLYEKYGCTFWKTMKEMFGGDARVYRMKIENRDYSDTIGRTVSGTVDRPLGTSHPRHSEMVYPVNYGYVDGVYAGDGAEQDVYIFGAKGPLKNFTGTVVAVIHRLNDVEDKWIVSVDGSVPSREEILEKTDFQERFFMIELYM
jgi:inorganic pyrophosphatase